MTNDRPWHEQDDFWSETESLMFTPKRVEDAVDEISKIETLLGLKSDMHVLDMSCGVGRHSHELARRGYRVTAVDRTERYLQKAAALAESEDLDIEFVREDMRKFCRPATFDVAINLFTSFGYFEDPKDDRRSVTNLYESLKPGGVLVMETIGKEILARIFQERDWHETEDGTIVLEERKVSHEWGWMENRWIILKGTERKEFHFEHRPFSAAELTTLLLDCGFKTAKAYGGIDGSPYDHKAQRLAVVARK